MVYVDEKRCSGCGLCVDVCPVEAVTLQNGVARIDQDLCRECEACADACPEGAILAITEPTLIPQPVHEVATSEGQQTSVPLAAKVAPTVAAALFFIGREVVPRVADYVLEAFDRRLNSPAITSGDKETTTSSAGESKGGGRRVRRRRRGRG